MTELDPQKLAHGVVEITCNYIRHTLETRRLRIYTLDEPLEHTAIRIEEIERLWQMFELDHQNEGKPQ